VDAPNDRLVRYLGAAFLAVFATSLAAGLLGDAALGGDASTLLASVATNPEMLRASNLLWVVTGLGIIALAGLLLAVLGEADRPLALIAFGWWLAEGTMLAVGALGTYGLLAVGTGTAGAGTTAPEQAALASLFYGIRESAFTMHMLFFCIGGLAWYGLMLRSRLVPRWIAAWGMVGVALLLAAMLVMAWDRGLELGILGGLAMLVYVPFEPVLGSWLLLRGAGARTTATGRLREVPA